MPHKIYDVDGFKMAIDVKDGGIGVLLASGGHREKAFMKILKNEIDAGMVAIDLGANIGYATIYMADLVGPEGKVYAIEPGPQNMPLLNETIQANGWSHVETSCLAISDTEGTKKLYLASAPNLNSMMPTKHTRKAVDMRVQKLESYCHERDTFPNFIKMDVEGHEVEILGSSLDFLSSRDDQVTKILMEVHPQFYDDHHSLENVLKEYVSRGFSFKWMVSTPIGTPKLFKKNNLVPLEVIATDGFNRGIYHDVPSDIAIELCSKEHPEGNSRKIVRSIMLVRNDHDNNSI